MIKLLCFNDFLKRIFTEQEGEILHFAMGSEVFYKGGREGWKNEGNPKIRREKENYNFFLEF